MKTTINNIEVEGTPQEIAEFVKEFSYQISCDVEMSPEQLRKMWEGYSFVVGSDVGGTFINKYKSEI